MQCPVCRRENKPDNRFCFNCGSRIIQPGVENAQAERSDILQEELRQLHVLIASINARLNALENSRESPSNLNSFVDDVIVDPHRPVSVPSQTEAMGSSTQNDSNRRDIPTVERRDEELALPPLPKAPPRKPIEWEQILGGNWMTRIGVLTLVVGVAFFLKLSFDNQWSIPGVIVGVAAGIALLLGGYHWQKPYPVFAQALTGGGLAYLYLSIYSALAIFHLISVYPALVLILLVSLLSARLAVQQDSMALAILGIIGAFSAPLILGYQAPREIVTSHTGNGLQIISYVLIVDIGVLVLSSFRNWRWLTLLSLAGSFASYGVWSYKFGVSAGVFTSELSLTLIFLVFVGVTTFFHIVRRRVSNEADYALLLLNAAYYFGVSYGLMWTPARAWLGAFSVALALLYGGIAYFASKKGVKNISLFATGIALVWFTVAIPVQLGDKAMVTIAWAAEAAVLMAFYLKLRLSQYQLYSYIAFGLASFRLLLFDSFTQTFVPVFNTRVLAFLISVGLMSATAYMIWRDEQTLPQTANKSRSPYPVFLVGANFLVLWLLAAEVLNYGLTGPLKSVTLVFFLGLAGVATLYHLAWPRRLQIFDIVCLGVSAAFYLGISAVIWTHNSTFIGTYYLLLAVFFGILAYTLLKKESQHSLAGNVVLGISLAFFTVAIPAQFRDQVWTPVVWATEMAVLMWLSFMFPMTRFRPYSFAVAVVMAGRILLFDSAVTPNSYVPVLNERFAAFAVAILANYVSGYLLWRGREKSPDLKIPASTFFIAANFYSLWLLSFEVWDFIGNPLSRLGAGQAGENLRNAQGLSLTAIWAIYAVVLLIVGIAKRWRQVRLWALALLAVPILKLFLYDVFALQLIYRIIAFAALGILLLVGGYLYQRYGRRIREEVINKA